MMLPVSFLDDEDYETIRNNAMQSISGYQEEWTNYNASDAGITLLELLAWMQEIQEFYLERYVIENEPVYLELLGMKKRHLTPSIVMAEILSDQEVWLNKNTAFYADALRFEPERQNIIGGEIMKSCCAQKRDGSLLWSCQKEELKYGMWMFGELPEPGNSFYLGFDRPFPFHSGKSIYFKLEPPRGQKRNPVSMEAKALFSSYSMEFWDGTGWRRCRILEDETVGFLQSGCIHWMADREMKPLEDLFWLRFRLEKCDYDIPPRLLGVDTRLCKLQQKETIAGSVQIILPVNPEGNYHISLQEYFDAPEEAEIFVKNENIYSKVAITSWENDILNFRYSQKAAQFFTVLLVARQRESGIMTNWEATGFPNQVIELGDNHIMADTLQVLVEREDCPGEYCFWQPVSHFWKADSVMECYCFQEMDGQLLFGNGEHGKIPEGRILLTDCIRTMGPAGRVREQNCFRWRDGQAYSVEIVQDGTNTESDTACLKRFCRQAENEKRAVTGKDYEMIVKQTPGLLIRRVKAVSERENSITLVVECGAGGNRRLSPTYQRQIWAWLEGKRMLGTRIQFKSPEYIPVYVRARIFVHEGFYQAESWIREAIEYFFNTHMESFGAEFQYSHLYEILDSLSCVAAIQELTVSESGKGCRYQRDGSFQLPMCGLAVLEEVQVQLMQGNRG